MDHVLTESPASHRAFPPPSEIPFEPTNDQMLVAWEDRPGRSGLIIIPECFRFNDGTDKFVRFGTVVKLGPGERMLRVICACGAIAERKMYRVMGDRIERVPFGKCKRCKQKDWVASFEFRLPFEVKVGDRILYDHPSDREITIADNRYVVLHEEQHVWMVA